MPETIKVALLGLGRVGEVFAENFLERVQEGGKPVEIVAVAERNADSPVALGFAQNGIAVFTDALEIATLGDEIDVIFDLTGDGELRQKLRQKLAETKNHHTVIATELFARLLWCFLDVDTKLPKLRSGGYRTQ